MYKYCPDSLQQFFNLCLYFVEWRSVNGQGLVIRDEDHTCVIEGEWKRINTLQHYNVSYHIIKRYFGKLVARNRSKFFTISGMLSEVSH